MADGCVKGGAWGAKKKTKAGWVQTAADECRWLQMDVTWNVILDWLVVSTSDNQ